MEGEIIYNPSAIPIAETTGLGAYHFTPEERIAYMMAQTADAQQKDD